MAEREEEGHWGHCDWGPQALQESHSSRDWVKCLFEGPDVTPKEMRPLGHVPSGPHRPGQDNGPLAVVETKVKIWQKQGRDEHKSRLGLSSQAGVEVRLTGPKPEGCPEGSQA